MSKLSKPYPVRLNTDQDKAIDMLCSYGYNRTKFIRAAIQEKLKRDFRPMLAKLKHEKSKIKNAPIWMYE